MPRREEVDREYKDLLETKVRSLVWRIYKKNNIYLVDIEAEKGGGAAAFRELFIQYREKELTGDIFLHAAHSEVNLFFLYMGMIPYETDPKTNERCSIADIQMDYLQSFFSQSEEAKTAKSSITKLENDDNLSPDEKKLLKSVLFEEQRRLEKNQYATPEMISDDDLIQSKDVLIHIRNKQVSQLEAEFMPLLLKAMKESVADVISGGRFSSSGTRVREFHMSQEGFQRAYAAIDNGEKIAPFKNLEHLPLPKYQREELEKIINSAQKTYVNETVRFSLERKTPAVANPEKDVPSKNKPS